MRTEDEIQRAHSAFAAFLQGHVPGVVSQTEYEFLTYCRDAMCWVLGHTHENNFEDALKAIHAHAEANDLEFMRIPQHEARKARGN